MQTALGVASWFHLLAAVIWMGGVFMLLYVVWPELGTVLGVSAERNRIAHGIVRRFTPVSFTCIIVLTGTGVYMMYQDENYLGLMNLGNTWAKLLLAKHLLFIVMVLAAIYIGLVINPRIGTTISKHRARRLFELAIRQRKVARLNIILILLILLLTGLLTGI